MEEEQKEEKNRLEKNQQEMDEQGQDLEGDVGDLLPHGLEPLPGTLVEEAHGHVKGGAAPVLEAVQVGEVVSHVRRDLQQVDSPHPRGQQALVGVPERRVRQHRALVLPHGLGEALRPLGPQHVLQAEGRPCEGGLGHVNLQLGGQVGGDEGSGGAVNDDLPEIAEEPAGPVLARLEVEQLRVLVDEPRADHLVEELGVVEDVLDEGDVGLDAPDPELVERPPDLAGSVLEGHPLADHLDKETVVVRGDLGAGEGDTVEPDAHALAAPVSLDPARVRLEGLGGVLGGHPALDGRAVGGDVVLGEAEAGQGVPLRHPQLGLDQVHPSHLLGHRVLHLQPSVHLHEEVVPGVLVHEELDSPGVAVADTAAQLDGAVEDVLPEDGV